MGTDRGRLGNTQLIYEALIGVAAQGHLLHNDDTHMRVQSVRQEIAAAGSEQERTGIFTTSIISQAGQRRIALFFTGQKHAGENLNQLLQRRAAGLDQPLQMCDALSRNEPKEFHTLLCHCLLHGRRQFVDVVENFPEECRKVIESLREVYRFDAIAKEQKLSDLDRLAFHQAHSQPVMDDLQKWMQGNRPVAPCGLRDRDAKLIWSSEPGELQRFSRWDGAAGFSERRFPSSPWASVAECPCWDGWAVQ